MLDVSGSVTGHIPSSSKGKTGKNIAIEDVEDDIDEPPDSEFFKSHHDLLTPTFMTIFRPLPHVLPPMWIP